MLTRSRCRVTICLSETTSYRIDLDGAVRQTPPASMKRQHQFRLKVLWGSCLTVTTLNACALTLPSGRARASAVYPEEVRADAPLAYWRLAGTVPGALRDNDNGATTFGPGSPPYPLDGADFGGPSFAVEMWVKDVSGTLFGYVDPRGQQVVGIDVQSDGAVQTRLFSQQIATRAKLSPGAWHLLGMSWHGDTGLLIVGIDGQEVWRGQAAKGQRLPYGGRLMLHPGRGAVDEVAVFDRFRFAAHWLRRWRVAHRLGGQGPAERTLPAQIVLSSAHSGGILEMAWSPDGRTVASAGGDGAIKIWDAQGGALLRTFYGHSEQVTTLAWSPEGRRLASAGLDATVRLWDSATGVLERVLSDQLSNRLAWSRDGEQLAAGGMLNAKVWEASTGRPVASWLDKELEMTRPDVTWSPNGKWFVTAGWGWTRAKKASGQQFAGFKIFDASSWRLHREWTDQLAPVVESAQTYGGWAPLYTWSPDSTRLASTSWDPSAKRACVNIRQIQDGALIYSLCGHTDRINAVRWHPDAAILATSARDGTVKLWDAAGGRLLRQLKGRIKATNTIRFSPDGKNLAVSNGGEVWIARTIDGRYLHVLKTDSSNAWIRWSPQGDAVAIDEYRTVGIWDVQRQARRRFLGTRTPPSFDAHWDRRSGRLLAAGQGPRIVQWDLKVGAPRTVVDGGDRGGTSVRLSRNGRLVTKGFCGKDPVFRTWSLPRGTGKALDLSFKHGCIAHPSPAGTFVATERARPPESGTPHRACLADRLT